jgi:hypothetical protein
MAGTVRTGRVGVNASHLINLRTCPIRETDMNQNAAKVQYAGSRQLRAALDSDFRVGRRRRTRWPRRRDAVRLSTL